MKLKVLRYDPDTKKSNHEIFKVQVKPGMTILEALFHIRDQYDDSLAFRYSCRGAVCGTCAVLVNKVPRLTCRTQVAALLHGAPETKLKPYPAIEVNDPWNPDEEILVEPLPHLPVIRDLIVDRKRFFEFYRSVEPVFKPVNDAPEKERLMEPKAVKELEKYTNCVLCAACVGACPISGEMGEYLGPAVLAKLYRFFIDPREGHDESRLLMANRPDGWWGCQFHTNCKRVCPKEVPPNIAIGKARQEIKKKGKVPPEFQD
jgi:succinate dehydrogenase / fumarate reductase iron-sulfur subunit